MSNDVWTIKRLLEWTTPHFEKNDVDAPRLTAELLLAHTLKVDRVKLYVEFDRPLSKEELAAYKALIQRRLTGEPTQYLTGVKEFYNRRFAVDARVLIPRSETELLCDEVLKAMPKDAPVRVLDLCTGSGCIAITLAAERPQASVWASDVSDGALAVAKSNAEKLGVDGRVTFHKADLFAGIPEGATFDLIVSNPPYVKRGELKTLQREVQKEPVLALDGGDSGLEVIERLAAAAPARLKAGGLLALELGDEQGPAVSALLSRLGYRDVRVDKDLARLDRLAFGRKP